jgi:hypothetical protein
MLIAREVNARDLIPLANTRNYPNRGRPNYPAPTDPFIEWPAILIATIQAQNCRLQIGSLKATERNIRAYDRLARWQPVASI